MRTWRERATVATAVAVVLLAGGALAAGIRNALFETAPVRAGSFTPAVGSVPQQDEEFEFEFDTTTTSVVEEPSTTTTSSTVPATTTTTRRLSGTVATTAVTTTTSTTVVTTTTTAANKGNSGRGRGKPPDDD